MNFEIHSVALTCNQVQRHRRNKEDRTIHTRHTYLSQMFQTIALVSRASLPFKEPIHLDYHHIYQVLFLFMPIRRMYQSQS
jgi:hypothetical protein